jgi:putative transposase
MSVRKTELAKEECYHIYNRGVDKRSIFQDRFDYERFLVSMYFLNCEEDLVMEKWRDFKKSNPKARPKEFRNIKKKDNLVEFNFYCLNENHFHFGIKQLKKRGIEKFMQKIGTSYTMFFNKKYNRSGSLFQGPFKSNHVDSNEYFLYLSVYVNANHFIHKTDSLGLALGKWEYSSILDYFGKPSKIFRPDINTHPILDQFKNFKEYKEYVFNNVYHMREKKELEKIIEDDLM